MPLPRRPIAPRSFERRSNHAISRRSSHRAGALALAMALCLHAATANAEERAGGLRRFLRTGCDPALDAPSPGRWSDSNVDLYNGLLYFGVTAGVSFGGRATRRWSAVNSLDDGLRGELRLDKSDDREDADTASDVTLGLSLAALPVASIVSHRLRTRDCAENFDMMTDFVESFSLALMLTEVTKLAAGRQRPFVRECQPDAPPDATCNGRDRFKSFISGHATLAATGAGLTCAYAIRRDAWGTSRTARALPCGLGVVAAMATGGLRVAADRHWFTDVALGLGIGAAVGYFDTWGPFDWMKFEERDASGRISRLGLVMPSVRDGRYGAQLMMVF